MGIGLRHHQNTEHNPAGVQTMRRQTGILALLALCLLVVQAAGWQDDFQSGTGYGWTGTAGWLSVVKDPYLDTYALRLSAPCSNTYAYANPEQNFNYAAVTFVESSDWDSYVCLYSKTGALLCEFNLNYPAPCRVELIYEGGYAKLYVDGIYRTQKTCSAQPYNFGIHKFCGYSIHYMTIDDVIITGNEPDILGIIPEGWYVLKHPTDSYAHGLYSSDGTRVYPTVMHATYGLDNPADANTKIVLQPMGSGYFLNTTHLPVGTSHGVVTFNITELLINNPDAPPGYYYLKLMQGDDVYDYGLFP